MADVNKSIQSLTINVKEIQLQIKKLYEEGQSAEKVFDKVKDSFQNITKEAIKLTESSKQALSKKDPEAYAKAITKINSLFGQLISSYKGVTSAANQANAEYEAGFKKLLEGERKIKKLQEDIALKNIQLSKKANIDKLQDVVSYYDKLQSEYKKDSEEYLKIEKKKLDAQIKLQKESDSLREKSRKAAVEDALKSQKALEAKQKALRDKIAARNKVRTKKVLDFEKAQADRRAKVLAAIERRKEKERTDALRKGTRDRANIEKSSVGGGVRSQFSPKAIGGAIGSLTKYLGLFQLINAATRVFRELTIGSAKAAIDFQQSLANLGAVAGATKEEVKLLGREALNVAGATSFTANEIVVLQTELSKLGFSAEDVVESTSSIAFAAQALGSPLGETAALIGKLRNQFNLLVESTGMISDVLVTSINNSALSFEAFGTAIQYVGPIADNLGLTLEQTAGAMAVLSDAGFTASRVGTGLRGIFTELGKTSADVEGSLKKLADQQISLAEAVDLVGKRNAAQLITLLKNIDAIDEATGKYYEQGRAFEAAAKQVDTFEGQVKLLNSAWNEFQIGLGDFIANSNIVLPILDIFSDKAGAVARSYQLINKVGFEAFNESINTVIEGGSALDEALKLAGVSIDEYAEARLQLATDLVSSVGLGDFNPLLIGQRKIVNTIDGTILKLNQQSEAFLKQKAIVDGTAFANGRYEESVDSLIGSAREGINVNQEADSTYKQIEATIERLEKFSATASGNSKVRYEAEIARLKALQGYLTNTILSEKALAKQRKKDADDAEKRERDAVNKEIKRIRESTNEKVNAANERAKIETELADTADERADIERERTIEVSGLYKKQASDIGNLSEQYKTQKERIEEAATAAEKQAEILGSEVISDASSALKDFSSEFDKIKDQYLAGNIGLEEYNTELKNTQTRYREYIEALIGSTDLSEDAIKVLRKLADAYDNVSSSTEETSEEVKDADKATKDAKKTWEDFTDELKKTGWQEIAKDAVQELGEVLDEFNKTQLENTIATEQAKLEEIRNRYSIEEQIIKSQLENQLLTDSQFRQKQSDLKKSQIAEENTILKKQFDAQQKADVNNARLDGLESAAQAYLQAFQAYEPVTAAIVGTIGAGIAIASAAGQISAINQRKFVGRKFADGGVVNGPSHDQGGVPFSVQGNSGYEMEGGEYVINKRATSMHKDLLDRINKSGMTRPQVGKVKFAQGGLVSSPINESVDYLKAIAEATTSTAIGVSKPVRAFVSDKDLRTNSNERRLRDRNDRI
jgi:hypothetical protein